MTQSKPKQISFRADSDMGAQVDAAAEREELSVADFVRKIFRFGFREYQGAGSLHALKLRTDAMEAGKKQAETERRVVGRMSKAGGKSKRREAS
jgi:hypothetical protein